jgi:hypothetical protein
VGLSRRRVPLHALLTTGSPLGTTGYHVGRGRRRQIPSQPWVRGRGVVCRRRPWGRGRATGCRRWLWGRGAPPDLVISRGERARRRSCGGGGTPLDLVVGCDGGARHRMSSSDVGEEARPPWILASAASTPHPAIAPLC